MYSSSATRPRSASAATISGPSAYSCAEDGETLLEDTDLRDRIAVELVRHPAGLHAHELADRFQAAEKTAARRLAWMMAEAGLIGCEVTPTPNGKASRRYFAAGEDG